MQYHLNGFRSGDPDLQEPHTNAVQPEAGLPEKVDVLIVGCGPAGLTLAAQLSAFPGIQTRIVEAGAGPLMRGRADGVSVRSMEMFQAFGFAQRVKCEAYWVNETTFWKPDPQKPGDIIRTGRIQDVEDGLSDMPHVILNQARIHDMYLDVMCHAPNRLVPDYGVSFLDLQVTEAEDYPVEIKLEDAEGEARAMRARYVVGCDGARSRVRRAIGRELTGDSANKAWGVMDVLAVTDFPDIRFKCLIQSAQHGNILVIPREGGYLVRLYIELGALGPNERVRDRAITETYLIDVAQRILAPYVLDVKEVAWWSVYEIGQRLTDRFDDLEGDVPDATPRVFIAGDACHTHSPKAGQGMNVSMGDAFNLGWKLAAVLEGRSPEHLLGSYSDERRAVAQDLIDFDREWTQVIAGGSDKPGPVVQEYFTRHGRYTAGTAVRYSPSLLTGDGAFQALAPGFEIGMRFHSVPVLRIADAKVMELGHTVEADGRWRVFAFAGLQEDGLETLCQGVMETPGAPVATHRAQGGQIDGVIDLRGIVQRPHTEVVLADLPALLRPAKGRYGLIDYEKAFGAVTGQGRDIYAERGIDRAQGCLVIVRPDQYVADVRPLEDVPGLLAFFAGVLR